MQIDLQTFGIDRMSVREKLELIEKIWESLPEQVNRDDVPEWHLEEIVKRRAEAEADPGVGTPWRERFKRS